MDVEMDESNNKTESVMVNNVVTCIVSQLKYV